MRCEPGNAETVSTPALTACTRRLRWCRRTGGRTAGEVAVHDAAAVQERHAGRHLARSRQHGRHAQAALQLAALRAEPALVDRLLRGPRRTRSRRIPSTCLLVARHALVQLTRHTMCAALPCSLHELEIIVLALRRLRGAQCAPAGTPCRSTPAAATPGHPGRARPWPAPRP